MTSLIHIPDSIRQNLSDEVIAAIDTLHSLGLDEVEAFFQLETYEFIGLGFVGPGGRFTRPANIDALEALTIIEDAYKVELSEYI